MQEPKTYTRQGTEELIGRSVTIFFEPYFSTLIGQWHWDFASEAVFCSNVMLAVEVDFNTTKAIIHPDDVDQVKAELDSDFIQQLDFRVITTYGEVRKMSGKRLSVHSRSEFYPAAAKKVEELRREATEKQQLQRLQLFRDVQEKTARFSNTGTWWHNAGTGETWYSAEVFRIYDLAPFSVNSHLNSFIHFIHPEDREIVEDYTDRSYKHKTPLHIEYRIQTPAGEKYVQHISQWMYSGNGEPVLSGMLRDITGEKNKEMELDELQRQVKFFKEQLLFDEQNNAVAHWQVNLVTRKFVFSNNYHRLFGLRDKTIMDLSAFSEVLHPEDQDAYLAATKKMLSQHIPPELNFRIYRGDGKLRYIRQKAKLVAHGNDLVMMGTVEDVTVKTNLQNKIKELTEAESVSRFTHLLSEQAAGMAWWVWTTVDGSIQWSENFNTFLGLKSNSKQLTQKLFLSFVHAEDRKLFTDNIDLLLQQKQETNFHFRMQLLGKTRNVKTSFRIMKREEDELFIAVFIDVTAEHQLKRELKEWARLTDALSESVLDRVIITDVNHTIKLWNRASADLYGLSSDEVIGKNFFDIFPKKKNEEEVNLYHRVLKGERIFVGARRSVTVPGYYDLHLLPLLNNHDRQVNGIVHIMRDVTHEVELQQNLRERLGFIENLVESSPDRIVAIDRNLNYLVWNKKAEEYYGLNKEAVIGKNVLEIFPDAPNTPTYDQIRTVLKGETVSLSFEDENLFFKTMLLPIKNEKQEVTAMLWVDHDLSKEMESEKRLKEHTQLLQAVFNASADGIIVCRAVRDASDSIIDYEVLMDNAITQKWNGRSLLGKNYAEEFPAIKTTGLFQAYNKVMETGERLDTEIHYAGEGYNNWFRITAVKLSEDKLVATAEDITERKTAEEKLNENRNFIEEITQQTPDLITIHDALTNRLIYSNHDKFWKEILDPNEVFLMKGDERVEAIIDAGDLEKAKLFLKERKLLRDGEVKEVELKTISGKWLRVRSKVFKRDKEGNAEQIISFSTDITPTKIAEEEIKKQLILLRYTEYLAQSGTWEYDIATENFTWSEGMYQIFGIPQRMMMRPEVYLDAVVDEDRSIAKAIVTLLRKKHLPFEEVLRIKRNNDVRTLKIKASVINDAFGKPQRIVGVDVDLTDIHKVQQQLKESQHWLEQTTKATPDSITVYDVQKKLPVYLNDCLSEWTGLSSYQLVEMGMEGRLALIHDDDRLKLLQFIEKLANRDNGEIISIEYRIRSGQGKSIWLRNRSKPFLRDASGKVTHILSILQNVTEEIELREELKKRTQFAEAILDASVDRITVFDLEYRFVGWNKRCEQIHRKSKEEVIGKTIFELFPGIENYPEFMDSQERSLKGEFVHVPSVKDGFTGDDLELFYIPLKDENGQTYAVVNVMHDVSDYILSTKALDLANKRLENKNAELAQKNEEITSFAFVASHDMKEPLRKIHTFSDLLIQQEVDQLSPKGKSLVEKMNAAVHRMEILIDDILVLTRIHSDGNREDDVDLDAVLRQVLDDMTEEIAKTKTVINHDTLPRIKANRNQVFYLFKNLVSNAIKFQKPGSVPELTITAELTKGSEPNFANAEEDYLKLSFADNGFGFDQRYATKIFQVFQRLHGKQEFEGTGIGLAICKKIMENHGGIITVQSEQGKGSTFICYFPLN